MLVLGILLLLVGVLAGIHLLYIIGGILAVIGLVLFVLPLAGGPLVGGRRWY